MHLLDFSFEPYHVFLAALGASLLLAVWLPRLAFRRPPAYGGLLMTFGLAAFALVPGMPQPMNPAEAPEVWRMAAELVVIIVLFATGLRIDRITGRGRWAPTVRTLAFAMPLTIAAVAFLGWQLAGMTVAGAALLGAVLAPTDPVLAGDLQVGPPQGGQEHPVRFTLTAEAGLNDGLAFPFVHLGLLIAAVGPEFPSAIDDWALVDLFYRIAVGAILGVAVGFALGHIMFAGARKRRLADSAPGVIALAGVMLTYGLVELAEGYGFVAVFVAGVVCRRVEQGHVFHRRLNDFSEAVENAVTSVLLILLGGALPALWPYLDWRHAAVGLALILVIRPVVGWISLWRCGLGPRERAAVSFFGVRGIGSVFYLGYAAEEIEFVNENQLWALVGFTIYASTLIHGMTARLMLDRVAPDVPEEAPGP